MYTYYFFSSFHQVKDRLKFVKPVITLAQMVQFVLILGHCIIAILPDCQSGFFFYFQTVNLIVLLCLFGHFFGINYLRSYFWYHNFWCCWLDRWTMNKLRKNYQVFRTFKKFSLSLNRLPSRERRKTFHWAREMNKVNRLIKSLLRYFDL